MLCYRKFEGFVSYVNICDFSFLSFMVCLRGLQQLLLHHISSLPFRPYKLTNTLFGSRGCRVSRKYQCVRLDVTSRCRTRYFHDKRTLQPETYTLRGCHSRHFAMIESQYVVRYHSSASLSLFLSLSLSLPRSLSTVCVCLCLHLSLSLSL